MQVKHDIDRLERGIRRFQEISAELAREEDIENLIPIWRQPGYTTPAEFLLLVGAVDMMVNIAENVLSLKGLLMEASPLVGLEG